MRLQLPASFNGIQNLNTPLVDCMFVLGRCGDIRSSACTLRVLQVPSLFIEKVTGIPIRVHLNEEFAAFSEKRCRMLEDVICDHMTVKRSELAVNSMLPGSVVVDFRLTTTPKKSARLLADFDAAAIEDLLRAKGFAVDYVVIPGRATAQRLLQLALIDALSDQPDPRTISAGASLEDLAAGPVGALDPDTARRTVADLGAVGVGKTTGKSLANSKGMEHLRLELRAAHSSAFPSDPTCFQSLECYDNHALRMGAAALDVMRIQWTRISPVSAGEDFGVELEWKSILLGKHWLISLDLEDLSEDMDEGSRGNGGPVRRLTRAKLQFAKESQCLFSGLGQGVFRVDVKAADTEEYIGQRARCWVCVGPVPDQLAEQLLKKYGESSVWRFSDAAFADQHASMR